MSTIKTSIGLGDCVRIENTWNTCWAIGTIAVVRKIRVKKNGDYMLTCETGIVEYGQPTVQEIPLEDVEKYQPNVVRKSEEAPPCDAEEQQQSEWPEFNAGDEVFIMADKQSIAYPLALASYAMTYILPGDRFTIWEKGKYSHTYWVEKISRDKNHRHKFQAHASQLKLRALLPSPPATTPPKETNTMSLKITTSHKVNGIETKDLNPEQTAAMIIESSERIAGLEKVEPKTKAITKLISTLQSELDVFVAHMNGLE